MNIHTEIKVHLNGDELELFSHNDWMLEATGGGNDLLVGIPYLAYGEWLEVDQARLEDGWLYRWCSIRPFDLVDAFARNFPHVLVTAKYIEEDSRYIGASAHMQGLSHYNFQDVEVETGYLAMEYEVDPDVIAQEQLEIAAFEQLKAMGTSANAGSKPETFDALRLFAHDVRATGVPVLSNRR